MWPNRTDWPILLFIKCGQIEQTIYHIRIFKYFDVVFSILAFMCSEIVVRTTFKWTIDEGSVWIICIWINYSINRLLTNFVKSVIWIWKLSSMKNKFDFSIPFIGLINCCYIILIEFGLISIVSISRAATVKQSTVIFLHVLKLYISSFLPSIFINEGNLQWGSFIQTIPMLSWTLSSWKKIFDMDTILFSSKNKPILVVKLHI